MLHSPRGWLRLVSNFLLFCVLAGCFALPSFADTPQRTWNYLTTGNGHGFAVYDTNQHKIVTFLEHPYRYLRPRQGSPMSDGIGRRNLAFDFYFGVRANGGTTWLNGATPADPSYVDQSNIIHAPFSANGITADSYFFEPFGYEGNALIALLHAPGASNGFSLFNFHMGGTAQSETSPDANGESTTYLSDSQAIVETGPGGGATVYVALSGLDNYECGPGAYNTVKGGGDLATNGGCNGYDVVPIFQRHLGADGWMAVAVQYVDDASQAPAVAKALRAWAGTRTPDQILSDAKSEFESWRKAPPMNPKLTDDELKVYRQGETILRMGQVREPNIGNRKNHGMMLASLPPGEWHTGWVRDGTYATVALARMGHFAEARASLDFFLNAAPVGKYKQYVNNQDYRISVVRYFGTGEEEADYSGQKTPNVETDGWGLMLWAARQYVDASGDVAWLSSMTTLGETVYDALQKQVAAPLAANMEPSGFLKADSSIWEVHDQNKRHYAYTSLAGARGFCDMATIADRAGNAADKTKYQGLSAKVVTGFFATFVDNKGALAGSLEGLQNNRYTDAAVVEAFNWSLLADPRGKIGSATLDRLNMLVVSSGGYKRNDDNSSSYDNNEWILIDLRMSSALRRAGRTDQADKLVNLVVSQAAANFYLLPELYNAVQADGQIGRYTGSIPMVGYGGGAFAMTVLDRAGLTEPFDCGSSVLTDGGVVQADGGGGGPGGGGTSDGGRNGVRSDVPYEAACLCHMGGVHVTGVSRLLLCLLPFALMAVRLGRRARRRQ